MTNNLPLRLARGPAAQEQPTVAENQETKSDWTAKLNQIFEIVDSTLTDSKSLHDQ